MQTTTVHLDDELADRLARIAREQGRPEEEIIREAIAGYRPRRRGDRDFALAKVQARRIDGDPRPIWEIPDEELMAGFGEDAGAG